jgi:type I restriction enzyme, R subunit
MSCGRLSIHKSNPPPSLVSPPQKGNSPSIKLSIERLSQLKLSLEQAIARYQTNANSTVEVLQELINNLAQEIKAARERGEKQGLSADEIAFYDALAENESAVEVMGNDSLKFIAHE